MDEVNWWMNSYSSSEMMDEFVFFQCTERLFQWRQSSLQRQDTKRSVCRVIDVVHVGKRAVSTSRYGVIWWESSWIYIFYVKVLGISRKEDWRSKGRLARLFQYTTTEAEYLIKNFINDRPEYRYNNAMTVLHRWYGKPHTLLSSYRRGETDGTFKSWGCNSLQETI